MSIGQNVYIANNVKIGMVQIQTMYQYMIMFLEDDVFGGPSMVFTNVYNPRSSIERRTNIEIILLKKELLWALTAL